MSEQALDLKRSMSILRRHWLAVLVPVIVGLVGGAAYTELKPPMFESSAEVVLPTTTKDISTQVIIAASDPVLIPALRETGLHLTLVTFRNDVQAKELTSNIVSVSGRGVTAADAEHIADDVAAGYVSYAATPRGGKVAAAVLQSAISATRPSLAMRIAAAGGLGAIVGAIVGAIGVLAWDRGDRRLRFRDAIADTVGAPVVASIPVLPAKNAPGWVNLFLSYQPNVRDAWRLRQLLQILGLDDAGPRGGRGGCSVTVMSLSTDRRALALGPQLAAFAAAQGMPTTLILGPQQEPDAAAILRAACTSGIPDRSVPLRLVVDDQGDYSRLNEGALTVVVAVVNSRAPRRADNWRTSATLLGVSAGAATDEQLAKVAASAAADGRALDGIFIADPDAHDHTTGRLPQVTRLVRHSGPTRMTKKASEMK